jgi:hypothetical protein
VELPGGVEADGGRTGAIVRVHQTAGRRAACRASGAASARTTAAAAGLSAGSVSTGAGRAAGALGASGAAGLTTGSGDAARGSSANSRDAARSAPARPRSAPRGGAALSRSTTRGAAAGSVAAGSRVSARSGLAAFATPGAGGQEHPEQRERRRVSNQSAAFLQESVLRRSGGVSPQRENRVHLLNCSTNGRCSQETVGGRATCRIRRRPRWLGRRPPWRRTGSPSRCNPRRRSHR